MSERRDRGYKAILAAEELRDQITPHLFVTELRTIAADDLWTSMAYQRDSMAIHFTWKPETENVLKVLPLAGSDNPWEAGAVEGKTQGA